jgi:hypothetical protein
MSGHSRSSSWTFWRLTKVAVFTANVDAVIKTLIYHKTVFGAPNRHLYQTAVGSSGSIYALDFIFKDIRDLLRLIVTLLNIKKFV